MQKCCRSSAGPSRGGGKECRCQSLHFAESAVCVGSSSPIVPLSFPLPVFSLFLFIFPPCPNACVLLWPRMRCHSSLLAISIVNKMLIRSGFYCYSKIGGWEVGKRWGGFKDETPHSVRTVLSFARLPNAKLAEQKRPNEMTRAFPDFPQSEPSFDVRCIAHLHEHPRHHPHPPTPTSYPLRRRRLGAKFVVRNLRLAHFNHVMARLCLWWRMRQSSSRHAHCSGDSELPCSGVKSMPNSSTQRAQRGVLIRRGCCT